MAPLSPISWRPSADCRQATAAEPSAGPHRWVTDAVRPVWVYWTDHCWLGDDEQLDMLTAPGAGGLPPETSRHFPPIPTIWPFASVHFSLSRPLQWTMIT